MAMIPKSTRERWRAVTDAATPGEWRQGSIEKYHVFVECRDAESLGQERVLLRMNTHFDYEADAAFIAEARVAVSDLLVENTRLRTLVREALSMIKTYDGGVSADARITAITSEVSE
jgi:hypothetical protein